MFLLAGNIMPGAEKLWGELLFPEEKWLFFSTEGRKNSFSKGNKCSSQNFFDPGIMFFSLEDTFSLGFILWPTINIYISMGSVSYCPNRFWIISWPIGCSYVTTFKTSKEFILPLQITEQQWKQWRVNNAPEIFWSHCATRHAHKMLFNELHATLVHSRVLPLL